MSKPIYIMTEGCRMLDLNDLEGSDWHLGDIFSHLSRKARFQGATHFTILGHSLAVANCVWKHYPDDEKLRRTALLHDAPEFILGDLPGPLKSSEHPLAREYRALEADLYTVLAERYDLIDPIPAQIDHWDRAVQRAEAEQIFPNESWWIRLPEEDDARLEVNAHWTLPSEVLFAQAVELF